MTKILIAGPCVHEESIQWAVDQAGAIRDQLAEGAARRRNVDFDWVFKMSWDKANRTIGDSYRGLGLDKTLEAFVQIKKLFGCQVTTDIHEVPQAHEVSTVVDIIQIPAMLSRQTDLIHAAARKGAVNIKVGTNMTVDQAHAAADKASEINDGQVWLTYRGTAFGDELVFDPWKLMELAEEVDVIADVTHSAATRPGSQFLNARVAAAAGADGLFMELHPNPSSARSDRHMQLGISELGELLESLQWPK